MTISNETAGRLRHLQVQMIDSGVDLVAIAPTANMRYLLGFTPLALERLCVLLISREATCLIAGELNAVELEARTGMEAIPWTDADEPYPTVVKGLKALGIPQGCVFAADDTMRADWLLLLQEVISPRKSLAASPLVGALRMCKTEAEIEALARSAKQDDRAIQVGADACRPGVTEREVAVKIITYLLQDGAEAVTMLPIVASGPNGAFPHHQAGDRRLQMGDTIILDIGATLNGYKSDATRMVHLGEPSAEVRAVYQAVLEANQCAHQAAIAGVQARMVDLAARDVLERAGYGSYFMHRTGHGLGLESHEPPWITAKSDTLLKPGMVFSIEPGVYLPGKFGIRIEDIVVVTEGECRCLTGLDHELIVNT